MQLEVARRPDRGTGCLNIAPPVPLVAVKGRTDYPGTAGLMFTHRCQEEAAAVVGNLADRKLYIVNPAVLFVVSKEDAPVPGILYHTVPERQIG